MMHSSGGHDSGGDEPDQLDVFGAGLFSTGPGDEKVYNHNYDAEVNRCVVDPKSKTARRPLLTHSWAFVAQSAS